MQKEILQVKLNIILAWSTDPENLSNKEGLTETQGPPWEREIEKISWVDWGYVRLGTRGIRWRNIGKMTGFMGWLLKGELQIVQ